MFKRCHILLLLLITALPLSADESVPYEQQPGNSINEIRLPLNQHTAAELAKVETQGQILSVEEDTQDNRIIFRVKVLHKSGKVKVHRFDRNTGHALP
jgi:hypothetical protein